MFSFLAKLRIFPFPQPRTSFIRLALRQILEYSFLHASIEVCFEICRELVLIANVKVRAAKVTSVANLFPHRDGKARSAVRIPGCFAILFFLNAVSAT
jgi:hypothetical protein